MSGYAAAPRRIALVDAARGVAIIAMAIYHFSWDLRFFGYITADVGGDLGWRIFARLIAGSFLALVGISLVLAERNSFDRRRFLRRLAILAAAAAAVTIVTFLVFPDAFVFFGILHCIALSSVLALPFLRAPVPVVVAAAAFCLLAPHFLAHPLFDNPALWWVGLFTVPPHSNDFVPIFPWFGIVLFGMAAARLAERFGPPRRAAWIAPSGTPEGGRGRAPGTPQALRPLVWAGRRSLGIYLLHQPLLFGLVYAAAQIVPPPPADFRALHKGSCTAQCVATGMAEAACQAACACVTDGAEAAGLAEPLMRNTLSEAQLARYYDVAEQCRGSDAAPAP